MTARIEGECQNLEHPRLEREKRAGGLSWCVEDSELFLFHQDGMSQAEIDDWKVESQGQMIILLHLLLYHYIGEHFLQKSQYGESHSYQLQSEGPSQKGHLTGGCEQFKTKFGEPHT